LSRPRSSSPTSSRLAARPLPPDRRVTARPIAAGDERRVTVRPITAGDEAEFLAAARASRRLHATWIAVPRDAATFRRHVTRFVAPTHHGFVVLDGDGRIAGAINITNAIYGPFRSAYLGWYAFAGFERRGIMARGLARVLRIAFGALKLHRLEANIQPDNKPSIALARACGFTKEGYSPSYLKIAGRWRDHERWAIVKPGRGQR
jgi:[ribosomal protein S5]-alanine N-acetyltransferase